MPAPAPNKSSLSGSSFEEEKHELANLTVKLIPLMQNGQFPENEISRMNQLANKIAFQLANSKNPQDKEIYDRLLLCGTMVANRIHSDFRAAAQYFPRAENNPNGKQDPVIAYLENNILNVLNNERNRLQNKYEEASCPRIKILHKMINGVNDIGQQFKEKKITAPQLEASVTQFLENNLNNKSLDKYKSWQKVGLVILNAIFFLPLVTLGIKWWATGSSFFSLKGKSQEAGEKALQNINSLKIKKSHP